MKLLSNKELKKRTNRSLRSLLKVGLIPPKATLEDIAEMEYPDDDEVRKIFLEILHEAATAPPGAPDRLPKDVAIPLPVLGMTSTLLSPSLSTFSGDEREANELGNELKLLAVEHQAQSEKKSSSDSEEIWYVAREAYAMWCKHTGRAYPHWWFSDAGGISPPPAELENTASNESIVSETAVPDGVQAVDRGQAKKKRTRKTNLYLAILQAVKVLGNPSIDDLLRHFDTNLASYSNIKRVDRKKKIVRWIKQNGDETETGVKQIQNYLNRAVEEAQAK